MENDQQGEIRLYHSKKKGTRGDLHAGAKEEEGQSLLPISSDVQTRPAKQGSSTCNSCS